MVGVFALVERIVTMLTVVIHNAGHLVPTDQPAAALDMIRNFIYDEPFGDANEKAYEDIRTYEEFYAWAKCAARRSAARGDWMAVGVRQAALACAKPSY